MLSEGLNQSRFSRPLDGWTRFAVDAVQAVIRLENLTIAWSDDSLTGSRIVG